MILRLINRACLLYMVALALLGVAGICIFAFVEYGQKPAGYVGCFAYDAMLLGFDCKGFPGAGVLAFLLNVPLWLFYGPLFAATSPWVFGGAILVWLPIAVYVVSYRRLKNVYA